MHYPKAPQKIPSWLQRLPHRIFWHLRIWWPKNCQSFAISAFLQPTVFALRWKRHLTDSKNNPHIFAPTIHVQFHPEKKKSMFFKSPSNFSCWLLHWYEMQISPYANFRGQMQVVVPPTEPYPAIKAFVLYRTWPLRVRFWGTPSWEVNEMIVIVVNPFNPLKDLGGKWCLEGV